MKKLLIVFSSMLLSAGLFANAPDVNDRVLKIFKTTFAKAVEVKWQEHADYYTVHFIHSGIRTKINYDKEGNILGSLRYYSPELLPLNIVAKLKSAYPKKTLYGVTEVTSGNEVVYYVKIEDAKTWMTIKLDNHGNSEVYEKYRKG